MAEQIIKSKMQQKRGTSAEIASSTEVLLDGEIIYDKTNNKFKVGDGSSQIKDLPYLEGDGDYLPLTGGRLSGDLSFVVDNKIKFNNAQQVVDAGQIYYDGLNESFLIKNTQGMIQVQCDNLNLQSVSGIDVNNKKIKYLATPTENQDAVTKKYVDTLVTVETNHVRDECLSTEGGILTGSLNMMTNSIINVPNPTHPTDVANKAYVDSKAGGSITKIDGNFLLVLTPLTNNTARFEIFTLQTLQYSAYFTSSDLDFVQNMLIHCKSFLNNNGYSFSGNERYYQPTKIIKAPSLSSVLITTTDISESEYLIITTFCIPAPTNSYNTTIIFNQNDLIYSALVTNY